VTYTEDDLFTIAELTSELEVHGHRADIVILKTARAHAAFENRQAINEVDILLAAELALPHRLKKKPFQETEAQLDRLEQRLEMARADVLIESRVEVSPQEVKKKPLNLARQS
jgi:Mg-chelatase subunit ChlI